MTLFGQLLQRDYDMQHLTGDDAGNGVESHRSGEPTRGTLHTQKQIVEGEVFHLDSCARKRYMKATKVIVHQPPPVYEVHYEVVNGVGETFILPESWK